MSTIDLKLRPAPATASITLPVGVSRSWIDWTRLGLGTAARVVLYSLLGLMVYAAVPAAIGWSPTTVMTGSMEPRIHPGDVVVAKPVVESEIHRGQVLLFDDPDQAGHLRLHRYFDNGQAGQIVTKGDANPQADSTPIARSAVVGVGFLRVPYVGSPFVWAANHQYGHLLVTGGLLLLVVLLSRTDRYLLRDERSADAAAREVAASATRRAQRRRERRLRRLRTAGGALALTAIAGGLAVTIVVSGGSHAAFAASVSNPTSSLASGTYDCLQDSYTTQTSYGFPYNETSGTTTADGSSFGRVGTLSGGAAFVAGSCATNQSPYLQLDGTGQVTTAVNLGGQPAFTIETWFRTSSAAGGTLAAFTAAQTGANTTADRALYLTTAGKIVLGVRPTASSTKATTTPASYNDGAWHHVVATLSGTSTIIYVDGTAVVTDTTNKTVQAAAGYWRVGYAPLSGLPSAPSNGFFVGAVDGTTIYNNSAQTAATVQSRYAAGH